MITLLRAGLVLALVAGLPAVRAAQPLPRSAPEAQGLASAALLDVVETLDRQVEGMHSLMILRRGHVVAEGWWKPYEAGRNHVLFSLSKSFTSTAVGFAVAEGKLSVDDEVLKFFPEEAPADPSGNLKAMRVRDLLTMSTGHQDEPPTDPARMSAKSFLAHPVPHKPGTHFKYNTAATFMQSAIVQQVTGETVLDYLRPRLFEPLGIEHPVWETNFQGISLGGYGLRVRTEDIARFGRLYLQKGRWNGRPLLPASWVGLATSRQVSNGSNPKSDWDQGYGFQFWRCRHDAFRGDGAFGQYCVVMPEQEVVVAITSGVKDMQAVLNVLWDKLLPACQRKRLPANRAARQALLARLERLEVSPAQGAASPANPQVLSRRFLCPANDPKMEAISLAPGDGGRSLLLTVRLDGREMRLPCGHREWLRGSGWMSAGFAPALPSEPLAGTFGWTSDNTCVIKVCAYETPFVTTLRLRFEGDQLLLDAESNVAFGPTRRPQLIGRAE